MGADGAWIARGRDLHRIAAVRAELVASTTGAGHSWAAGFLYGYLRGSDLAAAGACLLLLGAETVRHLGAAIPETHWPRVRTAAAALVKA